MFNAPIVFTNIPDIAQIYAINDVQEARLDRVVDALENNIFLNDMTEEMIARWERMLKLIPLANDSIEDRRFRVKAKALEKLPYSYRVIISRLNTLCPGGYQFIINEDRTSLSVKLALTSKKMMADVQELLERVVPLNMIFDVSILYTQYEKLGAFTHAELSKYTYAEFRELV